MRVSCTQIYAALCEYGGLRASLSRHLYQDDGLEEVAAELQGALIWGEYRHGSYPASVSHAVEVHLVGVLASSDAAIFHGRFGPREPSLALVRGAVPQEDLCAAATPLLVEDVVFRYTGCRRTADLAVDIATAHADHGAASGSLPCSAAASHLFAACVMTDIDTELERRLRGVTYSRRGFDVALGCNSERAQVRASLVLAGALAAKGAGIVWRQAATSQGAPDSIECDNAKFNAK